MKIISKKNYNFLFILLVFVLFLITVYYGIASSKVYVSSAEAVAMNEQNNIDFGKSIEFKFKKTYDEYISFNASVNDSFEFAFYNGDKYNKIVINSGEWATITQDNSKPILHLIPSYIYNEGYDRITITPIRGDDMVYFIEDFEILSLKDFDDLNKSKYNVIDFEIKQYEITIKEEDYQVILQDRKAGLDLGVLHTDDDSIVPAKIKADGETFSTDIRLKGDWTDHLSGDQWSYRVELSGDYCIYGLQKFSLQPVATRNGIWEYLIYEMYRENGGVALRYDFADVYVNGVYLGVFAVEEFMEKRVIENSLNREGPIIKYNETPMWERWSFYNKLTAPHRDYQVFSQKKTTQSENLDGYASYAITLINKFIYQNEPVENVFDVEKYIKLYSILDIFSSYHGRAEHNMRHYYNPVTARLEAIPFDEGSNIGDTELINNTDIYSAQQFLIYEILTSNDEYKQLATDTLIEFAENYDEFVTRYEKQVENFTKTIQRDDYSFTMDIWGVKPKLEQVISLKEITSPIIAIDKEENTITIVNENAGGIKITSAFDDDEEIFDNIIIIKNSETVISIPDDIMKNLNTKTILNVTWESSYSNELVEEIQLVDIDDLYVLLDDEESEED